MFVHKDLDSILYFLLSGFIATFGLLLVYYVVVLFIVLLRYFICLGSIHIGNENWMSLKYKTMIVSMLNN